MATRPSQPTLPWRSVSTFTVGIAGSLSRMFYYGLNPTETVGLDRFLEVLDGRKDIGAREKGLITVSNHVCVIDDPLMWGVLPFRYSFNPDNHRWSLASHDICFKNKALSTFFSYGQTLPTHRTAYSPFGGLFQPTMTQAIRLLSSQPFTPTLETAASDQVSSSQDITDPFTSSTLTYSTNGHDSFPAPSAYASRRFAWIHIFPEGRVHQHPKKTMRYFRWGISRLILESEPLPAIIPIFIDGNQNVMPENRTFPRFVPRAGNDIKIAFGEEVDGEKVFGDLRTRWKALVELQKTALEKRGESAELEMGELTEGLKFGDEAVALRIEVTKRVRREVLKLRSSLGYPDEDPKEGLVETWIEEGGKRHGKQEDGSWVGET